VITITRILSSKLRGVRRRVRHALGSRWDRSGLARQLARSELPSGLRVSVYVASYNTANSTELCVRTMRRLAGYPFDLTVGDSGSRDGSVERLRAMEARGWLRLEVAADRRHHAEWLDRWRGRCAADFAVFVDSDVEFLGHGWLRDLVAAACLQQAALVSAELLPECQNFIEPVAGRAVRGTARPAPWLLLIDPKKTSAIPVGFGFHKEETDAVAEGVIVWEVAGRFFEHLKAEGLNWAILPPSFQRKFHHYAGLSWIPADGERRRRKLRDLASVDRRLARARRLDGDGIDESARIGVLTDA
jgi:hypothetical protein